MLIIGLTGGIATGKSTVSTRFREQHHIKVVDADLIARQVVEPGRPAYNRIVATFGPQITDLVNEDGSLNRIELGKKVFGNKENLKKLNSIVHPAVRRAIAWEVIRSYITFHSLIILDIPLLYESGLDKACGVTVTTACDTDIQIMRLRLRTPELSEEDCSNRINSQMSSEERVWKSDYVIENNDDIQHLNDNIDKLFVQLKPSIWRTVLEYFPPFGLFSAFYSYVYRRISERARIPIKKDI